MKRNPRCKICGKKPPVMPKLQIRTGTVRDFTGNDNITCEKCRDTGVISFKKFEDGSGNIVYCDCKVAEEKKNTVGKDWVYLEGRHIYFTEDPQDPQWKTKLWRVLKKADYTLLGWIKWHSEWYRYAFHTRPDTILSEYCLRDMASFCERETANHKAIIAKKRKTSRSYPKTPIRYG